MSLTMQQKQAMEYIQNAGGAPKVVWFDDDFEPIGPTLRSDLTSAGMIQIDTEQRITLTEQGKQALAEAK